MEGIKKYDEDDIFLLDDNYTELEKDIEIKEVDEITLKRIEQATLNRVAAYERDKAARYRTKGSSLRSWFSLQTGIRKAAAILLCFIVLCGVTLGCIVLIRQYVPGLGIVSTSSKLKVLASPYTVWKGDYYLRITSLSYDSDTKVLSFTAESNGVNGQGYDIGEKVVSGGIYFKEKWSQATPNKGYLGKGHHVYGNPAAEYHDEFKLEREPEEYYLELDMVEISHDQDGKEIYIEKPEYIVISFGDLKLVAAAEANGLEDFGQVVESNGIKAVAASRWEEGKLYADVLFESNNPDERVVSFNTDKDNDIKLVTDEGQSYKNLSGQSLGTGWKYLLFETSEPYNGRVVLNSIFIEKSVGKSIRLDMPDIGETIDLNEEIVVDGITIVIESIKAYTDVFDERGNYLYTIPDNRVGIDVKCRIIEGISKGRIADDKSYIKGEIRAGNGKSDSKGFSWGPQGLYINGHFKAEDLKDVSEITLEVNDIMLTAEGNWEIPIKVK